LKNLPNKKTLRGENSLIVAMNFFLYEN